MTKSQFIDEFMDKLYLIGTKENGFYTLTLSQAQNAASELYDTITKAPKKTDNDLRKQILEKIEEYKFREMNFNKNVMRWQNFQIKDRHISEVDFTELTDNELIFHFERIVRRVNLQM